MTRQFLFFCAAGVAGLGADIGVLYALAPWLDWYAARVFSFLCAATLTWELNRRFAFRAAGAKPLAPTVRQYAGYLSAMLVGGAINYATYVAVITKFHGAAVAALGVAAGSLAGLLANFTLARYAVFKRRLD